MSLPGERSRIVTVSMWLILVLLTAVSIGPLVTPGVPDQAGPGSLSVDAVLGHIAHVASEPHPMGSAEIVEVRRYIVDELTNLGLDAELQTVEAPDFFGQPGGTVDVVNVMARIPGTEPSKALLLMAHFDSVPTTPGANDNAVAVGVLLEVGRILTEGSAIANDVILLFTDGEEPFGRFGSSAFVADHPWMDDVGFVVNLEAAGGSGPSTVAEVSGPGRWVIEGYAGASNPVAYSFITEIIALIGDIGTDFDSFRDFGLPGIHFAYMRGSPIYHTMEDSIDNVGAESAAHHGSNVLGVIDAFGDTDLAAVPDSDRGVYFSVGRSSLVRYPVPWAPPIGIAAISLFAVAFVIGWRRGELQPAAALVNAVIVFTAMLAVAIVTALVWGIVAGLRPSMDVLESYVYLISLILLTGGAWSIVWWRRTRICLPDNLVAGTAIVWLVFSALTSVWLPGTSYLFVWTALAASVELMTRGIQLKRNWLRPVGLALVATPMLVLMVPAVDLFFQMSMPRPGNTDSEITAVVGGATLLGFLVIALLVGVWKRGVADPPS